MESRRLTFTLKPKGADKKHDVTFELLKHLPKGYRADLVAQAVYEYVKSRDGIHMVREQNGVRIINLENKVAGFPQSDIQELPELQVDRDNAASFESTPFEKSDDRKEAGKDGKKDDVLDIAIAEWFPDDE